MIARAPGKIVLSGAYSVLEGAPALVAAVDRYVAADSARPAELLTREVAAAQSDGAAGPAPWFDASALRQTAPDGSSRKLGLGSSAAILVASLGAMWAGRYGDEASLRAAAFPVALSAHRRAQGGGSGIDVAASVHGGVLRCILQPAQDQPAAPLTAAPLELAPHPLPPGVHIEVFASPIAADTPDLITRIRAFAARDPSRSRTLMEAAGDGARRAVQARDAAGLIAAIRSQIEALGELGRCAHAPIVTEADAALGEAAAIEGAAFGPSGAGGGDISIFVGAAPASTALRELAGARGLQPLDLRLGARGLHLVPPTPILGRIEQDE
jgi:phosphomevalonate kinase